MAIKVMVIDDSALVRKILVEVLSSDPEIEVIATAMDPLFAMKKLQMGANPDVITLDVEMPQMNGITFLNNLLSERYLPVIMFSSLTEKGAEVTLEALRRGAFDFVTKPSGNLSNSMSFLKEELIPKVKEAYKVSQRKKKEVKSNFTKENKNTVKSPLIEKPLIKKIQTKSRKIVVIGSSTGGVQALEKIIPFLPQGFPAVLIVQHMPPKFTQSFATRLDSISQMSVKEAVNGERIQNGMVYIAPGDYHVELGEGTLIVNQKDRVNRHRPSVDVLFNSVAKRLGKNAIGVMLTGMGSDGAKGMLAMKNSGAFNIAQDKNSSVVYGMPREAVKLGAVDKILSIELIVQELLREI